MSIFTIPSATIDHTACAVHSLHTPLQKPTKLPILAIISTLTIKEGQETGQSV